MYDRVSAVERVKCEPRTRKGDGQPTDRQTDRQSVISLGRQISDESRFSLHIFLLSKATELGPDISTGEHTSSPISLIYTYIIYSAIPESSSINQLIYLGRELTSHVVGASLSLH